MGSQIHYGDRKVAIRHAAIEVARQRRTITYSALGRQLNIPARGPWKAVLDEIGHEERAAGRPDVACLVVTVKTGYPSWIDREPAPSPTPEQKRRAEAGFARVWDFYATPYTG
jgi:hypothetical protein